MADNGINDMMQVMMVSEKFCKLGVEISKSALVTLKNLMLATFRAFKNVGMKNWEKRIMNTSGETNIKRINKISRDLNYARIKPDMLEFFTKTCKQHGVPFVKVDSFDGDGRLHVMYPATYDVRMKSIMEIVQAECIRRNKSEGMDEDEAKRKAEDDCRLESPEEAAKGIGADCSNKEFETKYLEKYPEDRKLLGDLKKNGKDEELNKQITVAMKKNNSYRNRKTMKRDIDVSIMLFKKPQIVGKLTKNDEEYVKIRSDVDKDVAIYVKKNNIKFDGKENFVVGFKPEDKITIVNFRDNSIKEMTFKEFSDMYIKGASKERSTTQSKTKAIESGIKAGPKNTKKR